MVAARDVVRVFALYEYETVPLSMPVESVVSQVALLAALQPQPTEAVTLNVPLPDAEPTVNADDEREMVHAWYVKLPMSRPFRALGLVTTMSTAPAAWAGVIAVSTLGVGTLTAVAEAPPKVTVAPATKPEPYNVTAVPPVDGPATVATRVTVGEVEPLLLTVRLSIPWPPK